LPGDDSFTFFAVFQTNVNNVNTTIIDQNYYSVGDISGGRASLLLTLLGSYGFCGQAVDYWNCQPYYTKNPYISAITVADNGLTKVYSNSYTTPCSATINSTSLNITDTGFFVGAKGTSLLERMNGNLYEIIIYDRVLNTDELNDILRYLSKKYNIKLN